LPTSGGHSRSSCATAGQQVCGRRLRRSDQATVRPELLHAAEAPDVVNLVEQYEGENLPDARNRSKEVVVRPIVDPGLFGQLPLEALDDAVVVADEFEIGLDRAANERIVEEDRDRLVAFPVDQAAADRLEWPRTNGIPSRSQRSTSQYHVNMHSAATTNPSLNGSMAVRKLFGLANVLRCRTISPRSSRMQMNIILVCRSMPQ
jgi:hypothetical protein